MSQKYLDDLARNVCDLIEEAELLASNGRWARAAGLAMYAGEEAIKFDFAKRHPEASPPNWHRVKGVIWNERNVAAEASAAAKGTIVDLPDGHFADRPGVSWLEAKTERGTIYLQAMVDCGLAIPAPPPDWMSNLAVERERSFYVDPERLGPASVTEEQARGLIQRAKELVKTVGITC